MNHSPARAEPTFTALADEAVQLVQRVRRADEGAGAKWSMFVSRSIDAVDASALKSQIAAMKKIVQTAE